MKMKWNIVVWALPVFAVLGPAGTATRAQQSTSGHASDFTSVEYYEQPHHQQIKSRLSGAEALPQPGGLLVIKQLKLETFDLNGKPEIVVNAPECVYDTLKGVATSPGQLQMRTGDGSCEFWETFANFILKCKKCREDLI